MKVFKIDVLNENIKRCMCMNNKLIPPCTYQGGKQRYAKQIVDIMFKENNICENTKFYDLCCGSGAITLEIINRGISHKT